MDPTNRSATSGSPAHTSKLAVLTAQFEHTDPKPKEHSIPPCPTQCAEALLKLEKHLVASLSAAGNSLLSNMIVECMRDRMTLRQEAMQAWAGCRHQWLRGVEEERAVSRQLLRKLAKWTIGVTAICTLLLTGAYILTLRQLYRRDTIRVELLEAEASPSATRKELEQTREKIQLLFPITRWQVANRGDYHEIKILHHSVHETVEGTFAVPELRLAK